MSPAPFPTTTVFELREVHKVPFYSQFTDITAVDWRKKSCGIASLAMVIGYYKQEAISVDAVLAQGIAAHGYIENVGWTYKSLISVARSYGLQGNSYDLAKLSADDALLVFKIFLQNGPLVASVHYKFDPASTIPHLVVVTGTDGNTLYYNDPAAKEGGRKIAMNDFIKAWKKRFIELQPETTD